MSHFEVRRLVRRPIFVLVCISFALIGGGLVFWPEPGPKQAGMMIDHGWTIPSPGASPTAAVYVTIKNSGEADRLLSAQTPVAGRADLHRHDPEDGVMIMHHLDAVDVPADGVVSMRPGGLHVMLSDLKKPLEDGWAFPLTLIFERAGTRQTTIHVHWPNGSHEDHQSGHAH